MTDCWSPWCVARVWHAGECIERCGAFVSESEAPRVFMSSLGSGSPIGWGRGGCVLVSRLRGRGLVGVGRCLVELFGKSLL